MATDGDGRRGPQMDERRRNPVSRYPARHLRHAPGRIGLTLDAHGWVGVDELLEAADRETATRVGARRGRPVILTEAAAAMHRAGHVFHRSDNGVWLTAAVPPTFPRFPR